MGDPVGPIEFILSMGGGYPAVMFDGITHEEMLEVARGVDKIIIKNENEKREAETVQAPWAREKKP